MIRKIFKQIKTDPSKEGEEELQKIFDELDAKSKEIAEKKEKYKEGFSDGARLTKHRFTI